MLSKDRCCSRTTRSQMKVCVLPFPSLPFRSTKRKNSYRNYVSPTAKIVAPSGSPLNQTQDSYRRRGYEVTAKIVAAPALLALFVLIFLGAPRSFTHACMVGGPGAMQYLKQPPRELRERIGNCLGNGGRVLGAWDGNVVGTVPVGIPLWSSWDRATWRTPGEGRDVFVV